MAPLLMTISLSDLWPPLGQGQSPGPGGVSFVEKNTDVTPRVKLRKLGNIKRKLDIPKEMVLSYLQAQTSMFNVKINPQ